MSALAKMHEMARTESRRARALWDVMQSPRGAAIPSEQVSARRRMVISLRKDGLLVREIAQSLDIKVSTVKADLLHCRATDTGCMT